MDNHKFSTDPMGYFKAEIARLEKRIDRMTNSKTPTVPIYNTSDIGFPLDSIEGQLALAAPSNSATAAAKVIGKVIPSAEVALTGGTHSLIFHGGTVVRVDRPLPAGTVIYVDFSHVPPFDYMSAKIHVASGWEGSDANAKIWERRPWRSFLTPNPPITTTGSITYDLTTSAAFSNFVAVSAITDISGDVISLTHPQALSEFDGFDTPDGHASYFLKDFKDLTPDGTPYSDELLTIVNSGAASIDWGVGTSFRSGSSPIVVQPALVSGVSDVNVFSVNVVPLTLPSDVPVGFLLVTSIGKKLSTTRDTEAVTTRPNIYINWGLDNWDVDSPIPHYYSGGSWHQIPATLNPNR